jgi:hypothetical protein
MSQRYAESDKLRNQMEQDLINTLIPSPTNPILNEENI